MTEQEEEVGPDLSDPAVLAASIRIQSICRGWARRKRMVDSLRAQYAAIVGDLEGGVEGVSWKSNNLCAPSFAPSPNPAPPSRGVTPRGTQSVTKSSSSSSLLPSHPMNSQNAAEKVSQDEGRPMEEARQKTDLEKTEAKGVNSLIPPKSSQLPLARRLSSVTIENVSIPSSTTPRSPVNTSGSSTVEVQTEISGPVRRSSSSESDSGDESQLPSPSSPISLVLNVVPPPSSPILPPASEVRLDESRGSGDCNEVVEGVVEGVDEVLGDQTSLLDLSSVLEESLSSMTVVVNAPLYSSHVPLPSPGGPDAEPEQLSTNLPTSSIPSKPSESIKSHQEPVQELGPPVEDVGAGALVTEASWLLRTIATRRSVLGSGAAGGTPTPSQPLTKALETSGPAIGRYITTTGPLEPVLGR